MKRLEISGYAKEQKEADAIETARCIIFNSRGQLLLLEKNPSSENPLKLEFPGGIIEEIIGDVSTSEERLDNVLREVKEETSIDLPQDKISYVGIFEYSFQVAPQLEIQRRIVHVFLVQYPGDPNVLIGQHLQDKHSDFCWISPEKYMSLSEEGRVSANSTSQIITEALFAREA